MNIGFIGLGNMGRPMARNLLSSGFAVTVFGRRKPIADEMVSAGASAADSPSEVAARSDAIITIVSDSPDVRSVVMGPDGILDGARPGAVVIDMSTISPVVTREIAETAASRGVEYLDAPVSGGVSGAEAGTLSIMVGGRDEVFEQCLPIFQALGKNISHMGGVGMGQMTKLCNQVIAALNIQAVCEGLIFGAKAGIDLEKLISVVSTGAAGSWMLSNLGPKMIGRDFEPGFRVALEQKDLRLAMSVADELKVPLPGTSLVNQLFRSIEAAGMGECGTQALITALERLAEHKISE